MKTIVLHDYFESLEGGGRLCYLLAKGLGTDIGWGFARPNHPFVTPFINDHTACHDLGAYSFIPLWKQLKLARAFSKRTDFLQDYQSVVYSGFYSPLAVHAHQTGKNILYCHTPPRFVYDQRTFYLDRLPIGSRSLLQAFIDYLQPRYEAAIDKMDVIVANSKEIRKRIHTYLGKESEVIYPPCDTHRFSWRGQGNYYLSMGRLDPLKQVDKVVQAFLHMPDKPLVVTSGGPELGRLKALAKGAPHISFTGWIDDDKLAALVGNAIATIYVPKNEDFGMSPLESMAAGKPVIGVAQGGLVETIIPEETGILISSQVNVDAIYKAVQILTPRCALGMRLACEEQAKRFRVERFLEQMQALL